MAEATGLRAGWALDLTVDQDDGTPWVLSIKANQDKARKLQQEQAPHLLIASPMCAAFSTLQNLNHDKLTAQELIDKVRDAMEHFEFALEFCENHAKAGRLFLI